MARLNFLDRFRPVGAPGASGSIGHTDEVRGPAVELAPVFAALAPDVESARALAAEASQSAEKALAAARLRASDLTSQARLDAVAERNRAASAVEKASDERDRRLIARAHEGASTLEAKAALELDAVTQRVVEAMVTELLGGSNSRGSGEGGS